MRPRPAPIWTGDGTHRLAPLPCNTNDEGVKMQQRVEVYFNLHKHCLSYRPSGGRVRHARSLTLQNVKFNVQPAGREKVIREKKKNVHAFVRGIVINSYAETVDDKGKIKEYCEQREMRRITYNPYKYESFVYADTEEPVFEAKTVIVVGRDIYEVG